MANGHRQSAADLVLQDAAEHAVVVRLIVVFGPENRSTPRKSEKEPLRISHKSSLAIIINLRARYLSRRSE